MMVRGSGIGRRHRVRSFDAAAEEYDLARPTYPKEVYDFLDDRCGGLKGKLVGDGGAGTGVVTRQLAERGAHVVAFDPGAGMLGRAVLRSPALRAVIADAAAVPIRSDVLDLVCFGQSWHWVDQTPGAAEMARILRAGGQWAAWWNHPWADDEPWFDQYYRLLETICVGFSRNQRDIDWCSQAVADNERFRSPERYIIGWDRRVSIMDWLIDLRSHSYVIDLSPTDRDRLLKEAEAMLQDRFGDGQMTVSYETRLWIGQRK